MDSISNSHPFDSPMRYSKTAVFSRADLPIDIVEIEIPALNAQEILVRNEMATLCRSDLATYCGKRIESSPTILGHEVVGRIAEWGPDAQRVDLRGEKLQVGDRITWAIFASDPASRMAERGMPQKAPGRFKYGHEQLTDHETLHGGLSQYIILRPHTPVIKIREQVPLPVAAVANCAVATMAGALRIAGPIQDRSVLISGSGMLGILSCAMARTAGAARVGVTDVNAERLAIARRFGVDYSVQVSGDNHSSSDLEIPDGSLIDVVIETSGVPWAMEKTLELLAVGGIAVWVGAVSPDRPVSLPAERIVRNLISIRGLHNYNSEDFRTAVDFIESCHHRYPIHELIHARFQLEEIHEAFRHAISANPFRVGVYL
jgi:putative phosphonate catabolism associated alcohol dehydrogenase